jgi:hypothetical protein
MYECRSNLNAVDSLTDKLKQDIMNLYFINYKFMRGFYARLGLCQLSANNNGLCS